MAQHGADDSADGRSFPEDGFLRDMAAQSARAHTFDRRMRWFWLRRSLRDTSPAPDGIEDVVDLREDPVALTGEPAQAAPVAPAAPSPRLPRQRG